MAKPLLTLIDLPVFPKGVMPLWGPTVAAALLDYFEVDTIDLNVTAISEHLTELDRTAVVGLKVSAQNRNSAVAMTRSIKSVHPHVLVLWGGEFPTLLPEESLEYADTIVQGLIEPIASKIGVDFSSGEMRSVYVASERFSAGMFVLPMHAAIKFPDRYLRSMGVPVETSRGCTQKCSFCLVHEMQPNYVTKPLDLLKVELNEHGGRFVNVVDYNIGVSKEHVHRVCKVFKESGVRGWMAEMCLEMLDDDQLLRELQESRCRIIYCGLESVDESSLRSVNKNRTNVVSNYSRIISKVQSYGINVASGVILGLRDSNLQTVKATLRFLHEHNIIYAKLTYLTYNPGTKVHQSMKRVGSYTTEDYGQMDGMRLSYLPHNVALHEVNGAFREAVDQYYSFASILQRTVRLRSSLLGKTEAFLFALNYRVAYRQIIANEAYLNPDEFDRILNAPFRKSTFVRLSEYLIDLVRMLRVNNDDHHGPT